MASRKSTLAFLLPSLFIILFSGSLNAQVSMNDSLVLNSIYATYAMDLPSADMQDRYGLSHTIGAGFKHMTKKRWVFSIEGNYLFGPNIKDRGAVLNGSTSWITTEDGHVISAEGIYSNLAMTERGFTAWAKAGKLFATQKSNPNSGWLVMVGAGMLQHKIRIDVSQNNTPPLRTEYKKGYDRLCNGAGITEFIGYQYLDDNKRINCFAGLEFVQAWTQSRRAYYFADHMKPNEHRFDMLSGIKVGWIIPFYKKTGREYYYY
ncbi:MAG: hypothetical protein IPH88_03040 [Bacteroidales bacterium]|nr:hypothetical protein [Bacteroidales bacterium]